MALEAVEAVKADKGLAGVDTARGSLRTNFSHTDAGIPGVDLELQGGGAATIPGLEKVPKEGEEAGIKPG